MGHAEAKASEELRMKQEIIEELNLVDPKTLRLVHSMMRAHAVERRLEEDPILDYDENGKPIRSSEFVKEADAIVERMKEGEYITLEELREKKRPWVKSTE